MALQGAASLRRSCPIVPDADGPFRVARFAGRVPAIVPSWLRAIAVPARRRASLLTLVLIVCMSSAAAAQFGRGFFRMPPRFPAADSFGNGFNFCRAMYTSVRSEPGGMGWGTDYPNADINFSIRLSELTKTRISKSGEGSPEHFVVRLTDDALFQCPFVQMSDVGTLRFADAEVEALRSYLLKGGFLWVDDFWGSVAWDAWASQLARVLPPSEFPIQDIPLDHPIFQAMFDVREVPQIPSIQFWRGSGGATSERGSDSAVPHFRGVFDTHGHLIVLMTHNTDIADAWEREGEDPQFFYSFSPAGYALGINVLLYVMTH
jgi:Domain of unknown function (DUF4159)